MIARRFIINDPRPSVWIGLVLEQKEPAIMEMTIDEGEHLRLVEWIKGQDQLLKLLADALIASGVDFDNLDDEGGD